ncbi:hypothetical protein L208DRAFT_1401910 [Tricholoma matsutake]|nr:hypothetical protein L208DRAFT_1401910 [Tricholoma matsutake 945]
MIRTEIKELSHHQTYLSQTDTTCERFYVDTMGAASHTHTQDKCDLSFSHVPSLITLDRYYDEER